MDKAAAASKIRELAAELGFAKSGIARSANLDADAARLAAWIGNGYQGGMGYMENHAGLRHDPGKLLPGARSVISLAYNYYPKERMPSGEYQVSCYAYGRDYHKVIRKKMKKIVKFLVEELGSASARGFVDSAPVFERAWAVRAGLGWIGKNTCLITPEQGSYFFLAEVITDIELEYDLPFAANQCGKCTRCIEACPTAAIVAPGVLNASKCISYLTIENKDEINPEFAGKLSGWAFGCDICQDVCPWNRFAEPHNEPLFDPPEALLNIGTDEWESLDSITYDKTFRGSPVDRAGLEGLRRNIDFIKKKPPFPG